MKKFKYPLETILQLKNDYQDQALVELGKVNAECERVKLAISDTEKKNRTIAYEEDFSFLEAQAIDLYRQKLNRDISKLSSELDFYDKKRLEAVNKYIETKKDTDIYVKLKEKQYKIYKKEYEKESIKVIDDITITRAAFLKSH
ncbi:MAG: hypothetical protein JXR63_08180 [Spirochaetales bacterium]|nr:hypothetical protein [Spirochaetales bacterium]